MLVRTLLPVLSLSGSAFAVGATTRLVKQFALGTWLENLIVLSNGHILLTMLSAPEIVLLDPSTGQNQVIATFPNAMGTSGIVELRPNVFAVGAGNVSLATATPLPHTWSLWLFDVEHGTTHKVADVQEADMINGMTALNTHQVLAADPTAGVVRVFDTRTGARGPVLYDPELATDPTSGVPLGVNGVHFVAPWLYFTNSGRSLFGRIRLRTDGSAEGPAEILANNFNGAAPDDFALVPGGGAYATTNPFNQVVHIAPNGTVSTIVGSLGSFEVAGCTAAAFSRDRKTLYVVTDGGLERPVNGSATEGGKVVAISVQCSSGDSY